MMEHDLFPEIVEAQVVEKSAEMKRKPADRWVLYWF